MKVLEFRDITGTICLGHSTSFKSSGMAKVSAFLDFCPPPIIYRRKEKSINLKNTAIKER